ncbi:hypothetical protein LINPERPRIM_LOCUS42549 [Linum perenne]
MGRYLIRLMCMLLGSFCLS